MSILTDSNYYSKLPQIRHHWAHQHYRNGIANNWVPEEISMRRDVEQWKSDCVLSSVERRMILWNLNFFSFGESLTADNIVLGIYRHIKAPEVRQYLLRQAYEESIHAETFIYCCTSLGLTEEDFEGMGRVCSSTRAKNSFVTEITKRILDPEFTIDGLCSIQLFLRDLVGYYLAMEGIFFYAGFAMMLALRRCNKMPGIGEQFELIMRDEGVHLAFGVDLIRAIIAEHTSAWTTEFQSEIGKLMEEAVKLEKLYALDACHEGILGITAEQFGHYVEYIGDRRLESVGLPKTFCTQNPFPWIAQAIDLPKEKNFFDTRVTDYKAGSSLEWD